MTMSGPLDSEITSKEGWWAEPRFSFLGIQLTIWFNDDIRGIISLHTEDKEEVRKWVKVIEQINSNS